MMKKAKTKILILMIEIIGNELLTFSLNILDLNISISI